MEEILICPKCNIENNYHFVMYYGDACFNCDFDIRTYINKGFYNRNGAVTQLGEYLLCTQEVGSSRLPGSNTSVAKWISTSFLNWIYAGSIPVRRLSAYS